jgi:hypothetical protein
MPTARWSCACDGADGIALAFGSAIRRVADPRVMWHVICALGLMLLSLRTIVNATR